MAYLECISYDENVDDLVVMTIAEHNKPHHTDKIVSEHTRELISKNNPAHKKVGWHWYNNGVIAKQLPECPEGWVKGKTIRCSS